MARLTMVVFTAVCTLLKEGMPDTVTVRQVTEQIRRNALTAPT